MSLQAVWIIRISETKSKYEDSILFSRFYQTFIKKSKDIEGSHYVPLPSNPELAKAVLFELGHTDGLEKFLVDRDTCQKMEQKPVYEINTSNGKLWPFVVVEQAGLLFCCLPFVPQGLNPRPPLIDIPGVTLGFTLLCTLTDFLRNKSSDEIEDRTGDLYLFLSQAAPYGSVLDTIVDSVLAKVNGKFSVPQKTAKQPAWRSVSHKGKNQMYLTITEYVRSVQYDRENIEDVWDVYGTVTCKAELEGTLRTVTLTIAQSGEGEGMPINNLIIHPCVQSADADILVEGRDRAMPRRLRFSPPLEMFMLCHYMVNKPTTPPITGCFELFVEEERAKVKVTLQLNDNIKNNFDVCELHIPFAKRAPIVIQEFSANHGALLVSSSKSTLVWNLAPRFPARQTEVNMSAIVQLRASQGEGLGTIEETFCTGQNAYAQLFFKIQEFSQSGSYIDAKSIQVSPSLKYKLTCVREYVASEYKFWNVHGDSLVSALPRCLCNQQQVPL
ncbi:AP-5 complex subunit mu-1-like isoform X4 [Dreissena polymorpha]|uniref:AP-5 complex subunit mu-1 n=1 Tax=Dreissena polymorpha TaxID=45954 RepID=A0A9D3Z2U3_DREPO|nr:AP-5 complex subunit mu-1-like isoform X3 [Dreissena polymorpha]XP_052250775.1 AP-5 complex subunit mu-1-like isoform X4 [Dreissena polymorpha]KAH3711703.1 hypothetical protein DPMN_071375 [Dreissena polymorpha]